MAPLSRLLARPLARLLAWLARQGRAVLIAGLVAGVALPSVAAVLKPWLAESAAVMLYLAALRIGPLRPALGLGDLRRSLAAALALQLAMPCALALALMALGVTGPLAMALVLMLAAPAISGAPAITALTGADPAPAMRLLAVGAALMPLTVLPVFWLTPALGEAGAVAAASARLLAVILGAAALASLTRRLLPVIDSPPARPVLDGLSVIGLAVMVVGLMAAVAPALRDDRPALMAALALAFAVNFGLQTLAWALLSAPWLARERVAFTVVAGNRNMALFLVALPAATTDPMLLFIGCYQAPMYLTPVALSLLQRLWPPRAGAIAR